MDVGYVNRLPLWEPQVLDSSPLGDYLVKGVPVLDLHELVGSKLAALLDRSKPRDIHDAAMMLSDDRIDREKLRLAFVVYGAMSNQDTRKVSHANVHYRDEQMNDQLAPLLRRETVERHGSTAAYAKVLFEQCLSVLSWVLPLRENEREFVSQIRDHQNIDASLLTEDKHLQERINVQPGLKLRVQQLAYKRKQAERGSLDQ